jgi:P4 family phage/plasmid primase-like protien
LYLQDIAGMCAVGRVLRENLIIAYGEGGNGKSTLFNLLARVLGDYSGSLSAETLTANCRKNKSPEYAELRGKRLVIAAELEEGMRLDTSIVKKLCSTDPILAEKKYKDPFTFVPSHTVILYTNHLPKIGTTDKGTWDRIIAMPFKANFRGQKGEIKNYADYLYDHCGGAVLSWIIEGAKRFIANDYNIYPPGCVISAIKQYKANNDWLDNFLSECCEIDLDFKQKSGELYSCYKDFCDRTGDYRRSLADFKQALTMAGYETKRTKNGALVFGLRVISEFNVLDAVDEKPAVMD